MVDIEKALQDLANILTIISAIIVIYQFMKSK